MRGIISVYCFPRSKLQFRQLSSFMFSLNKYLFIVKLCQLWSDVGMELFVEAFQGNLLTSHLDRLGPSMVHHRRRVFDLIAFKPLFLPVFVTYPQKRLSEFVHYFSVVEKILMYTLWLEISNPKFYRLIDELCSSTSLTSRNSLIFHVALEVKIGLLAGILGISPGLPVILKLLWVTAGPENPRQVW